MTREKITKEKMVEAFQCPGCVCGPDPKNCPQFKLKEDYGFSCGGHVLGTTVNFQVHMALGLPKGFNRPPPQDDMMRTRSKMEIHLWLKGTHPGWDNLNVPVWALEEDGFLFVRTYSPRTDRGRVEVIDGATLALVPRALNVALFRDEFD